MSTPSVSGPRGWLLSCARVVSAVVGVVVLGAWAVLAVGHASDLFRINWVSGVWLALAQAAGDGTLYPPVFDGSTSVVRGTCRLRSC